MNVIRYGRQSIGICMILFFVAGVLGVVTSNELAVKGGFALAIISSVFVIFMSLKLQGEKE